ncbi:MAG: hypothetical protein OEY63_01650 [Gemmatimonadota bacterium]|nr:hypothetical protein [Gemmatimonadota bacterium]MDH5804491.1 hypothetical protein [Gemmatimonadota bacterium]
MKRTTLLPSISLLALAIPLMLTGQGRERILEDAEVVFPEPFSNIAGIRELSDGRVVVADRVESRIAILDFASGRMTDIGRRGQGPGEFQIPGQLVPLPDDATLLVDFGNMRLTQIGADGRFEESWPMMSEDGSFRNVTQADSEGRLYYSQNVMVSQGGPSNLPDSLSILRWDPSSGVTEDVATVFVPRPSVRGGGVTMNGGQVRMTGMTAFAARDAWRVTESGHVAVARANGYRVDWYLGAQQMSRGPQLEYDPVRVDQAEREAWVENISGSLGMVVAMGGSGASSGSMRVDAPDIEDIDFPDYKPPFESNEAYMTPEGNIWLGVSRPHDDEGQLFDVVDENGRVVERVRLPAGRELVGLGDGVLYATWADEDDLLWLERYRR